MHIQVILLRQQKTRLKVITNAEGDHFYPNKNGLGVYPAWLGELNRFWIFFDLFFLPHQI